MIRKIIFGLISFSILVTGYISFNKLSYWERSLQIFKINNASQFGREPGRDFRNYGGRGGFERFNDQRSRGEGITDSLRIRLQETDRRQMVRRDSLNQRFNPNNRIEGGRNFDEGRMRSFGGYSRGDHRGGKNINLRNAGLFFAVFASFTVITIYLDKVGCWIRKRRKRKSSGCN